jgi:hypothetical protein
MNSFTSSRQLLHPRPRKASPCGKVACSVASHRLDGVGVLVAIGLGIMLAVSSGADDREKFNDDVECRGRLRVGYREQEPGRTPRSLQRCRRFSHDATLRQLRDRRCSR